MIRKDGYYLSEEFPWVDWHAGHKFEGIIYYLLKFIDNNNVVSLTSKSKEINLEIFNEREQKYIDKYNLLDGYTMEIIFNPKSKWSVKKTFTILSPELILDENMKEYKFVPFTE